MECILENTKFLLVPGQPVCRHPSPSSDPLTIDSCSGVNGTSLSARISDEYVILLDSLGITFAIHEFYHFIAVRLH